ncbi:MAG TPA: hypothetical protein VGW36_05665 [Pyrinomonadaceae bacterium]|nr:hypothetical protein [Pyrinomonadaceae bacterium]
MTEATNDNRGILDALVGDGRPMLIFAGVSLILFGSFALFLAASRQFLPHDVQFLGLTAEELCGINDCRVVYFMFHDRVAFGGALIAIGSLYMWMGEFPLKQGRAWAWWLFIISGCLGFGSFLAYLGYGYLDTWHGVGTLVLLPLFVVGLTRSYRSLQSPKDIKALIRPGVKVSWVSAFGIGRLLLLATAAGMIAGGFTVMVVGMTTVFVPQDLSFMAIERGQLQAISDRLIPLIAHDRAGFGGAICATGITVLFCVWCAEPSKSLWQVLLLAGLVGFTAAIGVHPAVGYTDLFHLAPAIVGAIIFVLGLILCYQPMHSRLAEFVDPR